MSDQRKKRESRERLSELFAHDEKDEVHIRAEREVMEFILSVERLRRETGLSQAELGRRVGATRSQVGRWLDPDSGLRASTMFLLAAALGYVLRLQWVRDDEDPCDEGETEQYISERVISLERRLRERARSRVAVEYDGLVDDDTEADLNAGGETLSMVA